MKLKQTIYGSSGMEGKLGFENLKCYKLALDMVVNVHEMAKHLLLEEKHVLAIQIHHSSKSVTANIAGGYVRYHYQGSPKSYSIVYRELNETLSDLINAYKLDYVEREFFNQPYDLFRQSEAALNGFMRYVRKQCPIVDNGNNHRFQDKGVEYINEFPSMKNGEDSR